MAASSSLQPGHPFAGEYRVVQVVQDTFVIQLLGR
jgi:hypothetical protein